MLSVGSNITSIQLTTSTTTKLDMFGTLIHLLNRVCYKHTEKCPYCDSCVNNCHCDIWKAINEGRIDFNEDIAKILMGPVAIKQKRFHIRSCFKKLLKFEKPPSFITHVSPQVRATNELVTSPQMSTDTQRVHESPNIKQSQQYINIPKSLKYNILKGCIVTKLLKERIRSDRNRKTHSILGDYCPVHLRNEKYVDYEGEQYKVTQECLAQNKLLEQEGQEKPRYVHNPSNNHVFWLIRPFNFDKDYRYSMICEKALQHREPWTCYHKGIQCAPRKHILRRWLNRKWEWETIIDYIFRELGPGVERPIQETPMPPTICPRESLEENDISDDLEYVVQSIYHEPNYDLDNENVSLGRKLYAFERLVSICDFSSLLNDIEHLDTQSVITI